MIQTSGPSTTLIPRDWGRATSGCRGGRAARRSYGSTISSPRVSYPASRVPRVSMSESISEARTTTWRSGGVVASVWESIAGFLDQIGRNPADPVLFVGVILLLIIALVVHHIRQIRKQDIWVHHAWGAEWEG